MKDNFIDACEQLRKLCEMSADTPIKVGLDVPLAFSCTKRHSPDEIAQFEGTYRCLLPESYRHFLTVVGAGELFIDPYGLGIVFPPLDGLREFSKSVFENAARDPFPDLLLIATLTSRGDFAGFRTRCSSDETFAVLSHEVDPGAWLAKTEKWHRFSSWIEQLVASNGERDLP